MRSPLFYPLNRGADADAGGAADLQTDVMRFMAILSLCLVAIFALVQSIPMTPQQPAPKPPPSPTTQQQPVESTPPPNELELTRPSLEKVTVKEETILVRPARSSPAETPVAKQEPETLAVEASPVEKGFTLRFETDLALTRLVEQDAVGLYVITAGQASRMNIDNGKINFWSASTPGQFHEMDVATVPQQITAAHRRHHGLQTADSKWGVTLPGSMSRQLSQFLVKHEGGSLIISAAGDLRLEQ
jgi:hypothetical protein